MKWKISILGFAFAAFVAGCSNPADNVTPAKVKEPEKPAPVVDNAKSYVFDNDSSDLQFVGSKVTGSHEGGFQTFTGTFSAKDGKLVAGTVDIDMNSTWSDSDKLTGHLKNADFFDVEKFPKSTFVITGVAEAEGKTTVTGNLTFHGVTKSISFPADVTVSDTEATLKAEFFIKRFEFDIKYPGKADNLIRDEVVIKLNVTAKAG